MNTQATERAKTLEARVGILERLLKEAYGYMRHDKSCRSQISDTPCDCGMPEVSAEISQLLNFAPGDLGAPRPNPSDGKSDSRRGLR